MGQPSSKPKPEILVTLTGEGVQRIEASGFLPDQLESFKLAEGVAGGLALLHAMAVDWARSRQTELTRRQRAESRGIPAGE